MAGSETCSNCRYFKKVIPEGESNNAVHGECRRNPPYGTQTYAMWPKVSWDDWCGEFKGQMVPSGNGKRSLSIGEQGEAETS